MAFMDQARKATLAAACKTALAKWPRVKWTLSVKHHSTIVMTIAVGDIDFEAGALKSGESSRFRNGHANVNRFRIDRDWRGPARDFLAAANEALGTGNHDNSDVQADYHDVGWFIDIQIGRWNKPYVCTAGAFEEDCTSAAHPKPLTIDEMHAATSSGACPVCGSTEDHTGLVCLKRPAEPSRFLPAELDCGPVSTAERGALMHRMAEAAADLPPVPAHLAALPEDDRGPIAAALATVRASSFLSPIELIGAEQHEADHLGASIDNLTEPVRRGHITIRDALERVTRAAYQYGFSAGARYAARSK